MKNEVIGLKIKRIMPAVLIICFFLTLGLIFKPAPKPEMTPEAIYALEAEREFAAAWYEAQQKNIDRLDRNFRMYQDILSGFEEGKITGEECAERLTELEEEARSTLISIRNNLPSTELSDETYDLTVAIREKTVRYGEAMYHSIGKVRLAAGNGANFQALDEIRAVENPIGLFVADEVVKLRNALEVKKN